MASITIRNLDDDLKALLRIAATSHGRSMEEEVRVILRSVLTKPSQEGGWAAVSAHVLQRWVVLIWKFQHAVIRLVLRVLLTDFLDANVLSELMRAKPEPAVLD